jgi:glutathione S-transferase
MPALPRGVKNPMLKLYHGDPFANSLKVLIGLTEKGLPFESRPIDLHRFEQHEPWFVAINPEGQVPVLDHDGAILTQSSVILEYLEDACPETPALRPASPLAKARMRSWVKFIDEHVMAYVSMHGWHVRIGAIARAVEPAEFERLIARIPLQEQREKWRAARAGFPVADLANATRKVEVAIDRAEAQLKDSAWLAGDMFTLADINFFTSCGVTLGRLFPQMRLASCAPHLLDWLERVSARPGVQTALATPGPSASGAAR